MKNICFALFTILVIGCSPKIFKSSWTKEKAPTTFDVRFETTQGDFEIHVERQWSPKAVDRFYQLTKHNYFENGVFYRVVPEFVAQFGSGDSIAINRWASVKIPDEKPILSNTKGTLSFARSTKETRGTDLYINLGDNSRLDTLDYNKVKGFPAFGKVTKGMDVVTEIFSRYKETPATKLTLLYKDRPAFFEMFPKLDVIKKAYLIKK